MNDQLEYWLRGINNLGEVDSYPFASVGHPDAPWQLVKLGLVARRRDRTAFGGGLFSLTDAGRAEIARLDAAGPPCKQWQEALKLWAAADAAEARGKILIGWDYETDTGIEEDREPDSEIDEFAS